MRKHRLYCGCVHVSKGSIANVAPSGYKGQKYLEQVSVSVPLLFQRHERKPYTCVVLVKSASLMGPLPTGGLVTDFQPAQLGGHTFNVLVLMGFMTVCNMDRLARPLDSVPSCLPLPSALLRTTVRGQEESS